MGGARKLFIREQLGGGGQGMGARLKLVSGQLPPYPLLAPPVLGSSIDV